MFTRFNGNVVPFADDATSTNRTVFGGTTQSDLIDDNLNTNFKKGWEIVGLNDNPTREDFNAMGYTLGALTAYLYEMGISEWNASQNYRTNSRVTGSDGKIYKSLTGTTGIPNVGNNPTTDAVNWVAEGSTDYSALINKTTPVNADLIAIADSTSSFSLKKLSFSNLKATLISSFDTLYLALTGNQTVDGVKTFSSSPIVPTPTSNTQVANKAYVDTISPTWTANDSRVKTALNASGSAPIYACRAWVNFNGIGTVAIRASGNVSSITDNGVGDYTVNFTTAMPDANYTTTHAGGARTIDWGIYMGTTSYGSLATSHRFYNMKPSDVTSDTSYCSLAFFR